MYCVPTSPSNLTNLQNWAVVRKKNGVVELSLSPIRRRCMCSLGFAKVESCRMYGSLERFWIRNLKRRCVRAVWHTVATHLERNVPLKVTGVVPSEPRQQYCNSKLTSNVTTAVIEVHVYPDSWFRCGSVSANCCRCA